MVACEQRVPDGAGQGKGIRGMATLGVRKTRYTLLLNRWEAKSGAAKSGHHLVRNDQGTVSTGQVRCATKPGGRLSKHPGSSLHERFYRESSVRFTRAPSSRELFLQQRETF